MLGRGRPQAASKPCAWSNYVGWWLLDGATAQPAGTGPPNGSSRVPPAGEHLAVKRSGSMAPSAARKPGSVLAAAAVAAATENILRRLCLGWGLDNTGGLLQWKRAGCVYGGRSSCAICHHVRPQRASTAEACVVAWCHHHQMQPCRKAVQRAPWTQGLLPVVHSSLTAGAITAYCWLSPGRHLAAASRCCWQGPCPVPLCLCALTSVHARRPCTCKHACEYARLTPLLAPRLPACAALAAPDPVHARRPVPRAQELGADQAGGAADRRPRQRPAVRPAVGRPRQGHPGEEAWQRQSGNRWWCIAGRGAGQEDWRNTWACTQHVMGSSG